MTSTDQRRFTNSSSEAMVSKPLSHLLFVDDDSSMRQSFARILRKNGFIVDLAESAQEAIAMARQRHYPVIVSDLNMPQMDGLTMIEGLEVTMPHTAFIILTADGSFQRKARHNALFERGRAQVLAKPLDVKELIVAINRGLELRNFNQPPRPKVLILQEDENASENLARIICEKDEDYDVVQAHRLNDALAFIHDEAIDVVITELVLPDALGLDAVRKLSAASTDLAIVVLTCVDDEEIGMRAIQLGAQDFLLKGQVDADRIKRVIRFSHQRKASSQRMVQLAHFDQLTGLYNRTSFFERLDHAVESARRSGTYFALLYIDLDGFKPINDSFGHERGDRVLQEVAERLRQQVREVDMVARLGGDEFVVLLEDYFDPRDFYQTISRIRKTFHTPICLDGDIHALHASIGVATFPDDAASGNELLEAADHAMYEAKKLPQTAVVYGKGFSSVDLVYKESLYPLMSDVSVPMDFDEEWYLRFQRG